MRGLQPRGHYHQWGTAQSEDGSPQSDDDEDDDEELQNASPELLGTGADKKVLAGVLKRFSKDNLADESDSVVAAIRMQVRAVAPFRRLLNVVTTCGLWLLFQPREDSASLLLTKKGRFICWGRGQEAQPGAVRAYLGNVLCFLVLIFVLLLMVWSWVLRLRASILMRISVIVFSVVLVLLALLYCWAQRPRRDCGTSFRQHFEIQEMCVGTYVRVDEGRRLSQLCAQRRLGHLQLCFSRRYPRADLLWERLPPGAPGSGGVQPVEDLPSALAGETSEVQKEVLEQEGGINNAVLTRIAAILAVLSLIGAAYDYTSFLDKVRIDGQMCLNKVHGCNWRVENSRLLGKVKRAEGAYPPADYVEGGCNANGDYCNYFLRPTGHCAERGEAFTNDITAFHVRLECKILPDLAEATRRVTYIDKANNGQVQTVFLLKHDLTIWSMPLDKTAKWEKVLLTEGMRIVKIGPEDSEENQNLQKGVALHPLALLSRCFSVYRGHLDLVLVATQDLSPMFKEDCQELQEACKAEGLGPETNGYWPPHRMFDQSYEKTICVYRSLKLPLLTGKVWHVLEQGQQGLTCRGRSRKSLDFNHSSSIITERVEICKEECAKETWCTHVFYKGEVPEAFRSELKPILPGDLVQKLHFQNASRSTEYQCLLYETCPMANWTATQAFAEFLEVKCGENCGEDEQRCMMVRQGYARHRAQHYLGGEGGCRSACLNSSQDVAQCNAYVYAPNEHEGTCKIYGPEPFLRPFEGWHTLDVNYLGSVGEESDQHCFVRSTDPFHQGHIRNRQNAGSPGILLRLTDQTTCGGCLERTLFEWLRVPSAFCMVLSHVITLLGACYVASRAHRSAQLGKAAFSGKPVVHMTIVQDPANNESFEVREAAYREFLSKCYEVAWSCRPEPQEVLPEVNCWERKDRLDDEREAVVPVEVHNYEEYNLSNKRRTKCFIDQELLGMQPNEKVRTAWGDTKRPGLIRILFIFLLYYLVLFLITWLQPASWNAFWVAAGFRPIFLVLIPAMIGLHQYVEIRREVQSLYVLSSWGRLIHMTRRPPPSFFPADLCPAWYGGTSFQLDSFKIGRISLAQLDMPARPLCQDRLRAGSSDEAWRRGSVTVRGSCGLLRITREHGEALEMYQALSTLAGRQQVPELRSVGDGGAAIAGLCPKHEILADNERHIWEHQFDSFGFFGDPFNYSTMLTLTDWRILVTRARWPKAFSLVGCLIGPRTCSTRCRLLQEHWGYFPYLTVTSVWYGSLESYVTQRVRAPPFWPGFMSPIMSLSVNFLEKYMQTYPAALQVTQRPYGIARRVKVKDEKILLRAVADGEVVKLRIMSSELPAAPRGQYVEEIQTAGGECLDLHDGRWRTGALAPQNTRLLLQAGDPEWDTYADEPWLHQLRAILDHISGRSKAPADTWEVLEEPPRPQQPGGCSRMLASVFGGHMLGLRNKKDEDSDESGTE